MGEIKMEPMELSCLVFENKESAIGASAELLGRVLDKLHGFRGFVSPSDTRCIMDEGRELTYSSQNPTTNNVKVSYFLRELPWAGLNGKSSYSGLIHVKNLDKLLQGDLLAMREDFKREYDIVDGIARPRKQLK